MAISVSVVYPHDCMSDWELRLDAAVQHHEKEYVPRITTPEKIKIQNLMYGFY